MWVQRLQFHCRSPWRVDPQPNELLESKVMSQKILVIEDNVEMCQNIASILKLGRYDVLTRNSGKNGIEQAHQIQPALILSAILIPHLDAYLLLIIFSQHLSTPHI